MQGMRQHLLRLILQGYCKVAVFAVPNESLNAYLRAELNLVAGWKWISAPIEVPVRQSAQFLG